MKIDSSLIRYLPTTLSSSFYPVSRWSCPCGCLGSSLRTPLLSEQQSWPTPAAQCLKEETSVLTWASLSPWQCGYGTWSRCWLVSHGVRAHLLTPWHVLLSALGIFGCIGRDYKCSISHLVAERSSIAKKKFAFSPIYLKISHLNELESWAVGLLWLFRELWSGEISLLFISKCVFSGRSSINNESPVWEQICFETWS